MRSRLGTLLKLMPLFLVAGCSTPSTVIRPFLGTEFQSLTNGQAFVAPMDGYFLSDEYLEQAIEAREERKK